MSQYPNNVGHRLIKAKLRPIRDFCVPGDTSECHIIGPSLCEPVFRFSIGMPSAKILYKGCYATVPPFSHPHITLFPAPRRTPRYCTFILVDSCTASVGKVPCEACYKLDLLTLVLKTAFRQEVQFIR